VIAQCNSAGDPPSLTTRARVLLRLLPRPRGRLPVADVLRHVECTTTVATGNGPDAPTRPRAGRPAAVGGPSAVWQDGGIACRAGLGTGAGVRPKATRPPPLGSASPGAAVPAGSGIPAQLPWASRSRASRCPSGGRSEICLPCGWQHWPSSDACSCQVRPSQHQPWLVSTCSVTHTPLHRLCNPSASTRRPVKHTSRAARTGPRLNEDDRRPRTVGCRTALVAAPGGQSSADDGSSVSPAQHRLSFPPELPGGTPGHHRPDGLPLPGGSVSTTAENWFWPRFRDRQALGIVNPAGRRTSVPRPGRSPRPGRRGGAEKSPSDARTGR
jgi:hypothetical protein